MAASDQQVQIFVDSRIRPFCEAIRALAAAAADNRAAIGDVYTALTEQNPTWKDARADGPPHLMTPNDVLAINTVMQGLVSMCGGDGNAGNMAAVVGQWPVVLAACVRALSPSAQ